MNDSTQVIESIRQCEAFIAKMTQKIKDMESEIKTMESQSIQLLNKCKDLEANIEYKNKIIDGKLCEKNILTHRLQMYEKMVSDAQNRLENEEAKLQESQHDLWRLRIQFTTNVMEFVKENDYLMHNNAKILETVQKRKTEKNIEKSIDRLEKEILQLENEFGAKKGQLDIIERLEIDKERLEKEPETGATFKKLQNQIEIYLKELNRCDEHDERVNLSLSTSDPTVEQVCTFTLKVPSKICNLKTLKKMKEM